MKPLPGDRRHELLISGDELRELEMFKHADIKQAPCYDVEADDKRRARLNCIADI